MAPVPNQGNADKQIWYLTDWVDGRYNVHSYGRLWKLEIDTAAADWLGDSTLEPLSSETLLAWKLRSGQVQKSSAELFELASDEDPFLAQAALSVLARQANAWKTADVQALPPEDRVSAVLALAIASNASYQLSMPTVSDKPWVEMLLSDSNPAVRFETLRWIADAQLDEYLPQVERILGEKQLPFQVFEAAIAAYNTLSGQPELGLRNTPMLLSRVTDSTAEPQLRAFALRLLPIVPRAASTDENEKLNTSLPEGLTTQVLKELLAVGNEELSLETVRVLAGNPAEHSSLLLELALNPTEAVSVRAEALVGLAPLAEKNVEAILSLASHEDKSLREEALRALRGVTLDTEQQAEVAQLKNTYAASSDLIAALLVPKSIAKDHPTPLETDAWLTMLKAMPGEANLEAGRRIFFHSRLANCSRCHRHSGRGNVVGPDLSTVGAQSNRRRILQSILEPSREMSPEFRPSVVVLDDGRTFTGIRLRSWVNEVIRDQNGQNRTFSRDHVEAIQDLNQSFMPEGLEQTLTMRELRDLLAFLDGSKPSK